MEITDEEIRSTLSNLGICNYTEGDLKTILSILCDFSGSIDLLKSKCTDKDKSKNISQLIQCLRTLREDVNRQIIESIDRDISDLLNNDNTAPPSLPKP